MVETQYLALLRGINVGGNNIIKMIALKACFKKMGFSDVVTYIQSGNVLFKSPESNTEKLTLQIEKELSKTFNYKSCVVIVTYSQLTETVKHAPKGFGSEPDTYRYDVLFVKTPMMPQEVMESVRIKEGVDQAWAGKSVVYFSRLIAKATQSYLAKIVGLPVYKHLTIRNWNSTTKLLALMDARSA